MPLEMSLINICQRIPILNVMEQKTAGNISVDYEQMDLNFGAQLKKKSSLISQFDSSTVRSIR